jgi:hypothetical protein
MAPVFCERIAEALFGRGRARAATRRPAGATPYYLPAGAYVFVAGLTDGGFSADGVGEDRLCLVVPRGGAWSAAVTPGLCGALCAASSHEHEPGAFGGTTCVEIYRDSEENRSAPLRPCGTFRFSVPEGGAFAAFADDGDGYVRALDGRIRLLNDRGWSATFTHVPA